MDKLEIIERAKVELGCWIEEGTANRGWYTCQVTGRKLRGQEAKAQLDRQREAIEAIEQELAEVAATAEATEGVRQIATPSILREVADKMTARLQGHLLQRGGVELVTIRCQDCGAERLIKPQDRFQVKRCVACQEAHRRARKAARRRAKRAKMQEQVQ